MSKGKVKLVRMVKVHKNLKAEPFTMELPTHVLSSALTNYRRLLKEDNKDKNISIIDDICEQVQNAELFLESYSAEE